LSPLLLRRGCQRARRGQPTPPEDAYVEALGGRLEIIADFGDQRLAFAEPGTEAA